MPRPPDSPSVQERERVLALLTWREASADLESTLKALTNVPPAADRCLLLRRYVAAINAEQRAFDHLSAVVRGASFTEATHEEVGGIAGDRRARHFAGASAAPGTSHPPRKGLRS